jgi:hypothetical protein
VPVSTSTAVVASPTVTKSQAVAKSPTAAKSATIADTTNLESLFRRAFELSVQEDGWAFLGAMGNKLRQLDPGFDPRTYGHKQLLSLIRANPDIFEIRPTKGRGAANIYVRLKQAV